MTTNQEVQQRKGGPRSRTGCRICRQRRVKCDESIPSCQRCLKRGLLCPGYSLPSHASLSVDDSHATFNKISLASASSASSSLSSQSIKAYAIPFRVPGSQADRQLLHHFCVVSASELSGFLVSDFWTRTVLQRAQHELVVRQAVVALSSLHRQLRLDSSHADPVRRGTNGVAAGDDAAIRQELALGESSVAYNRALRSMRKYLRTHDPRTSGSAEDSKIIPIICCILFYAFESVQGNVNAALQHLTAGQAMLQDHHRELTTQDSHMAGAEALLERMQVQAAIFDEPRFVRAAGGDPSPQHCQPLPELARQVPVFCASVSYTLEDAQMMLTKLQSCVLCLLGTHGHYKDWPASLIPSNVLFKKAMLLAAFHDWVAMFARLLGYSEEVDGGQVILDPGVLASAVQEALLRSQAFGVLYVHCYMFYLILASSLPDDPGLYNRPALITRMTRHDDYSTTVSRIECRSPVEIILDIAHMIIHSQDDDRSSPTKTTRIISVETGLVAPLFLMIVRCDDPSTVLRAVQLLKDASRREGLYDSHIVAAVVRSVLARQQIQKEMAKQLDSEGNVLEKSQVILTQGLADLCELSQRCPGGKTGAGGVDEIARMLGVLE